MLTARSSFRPDMPKSSSALSGFTCSTKTSKSATSPRTLARAPTRPHRSQRRRRSTSSTATSSMRSVPRPPYHRVNAHHVVAHYVLAMSTQGSHISERHYKSRIPMSSNTRGCSHVQLNPHISMYKSNFATNARALTRTQLEGRPMAATQLSP